MRTALQKKNRPIAPKAKVGALLATKPAAIGTRQKLLDAAHDLIWANSYALVSVDEICKRAGVQKGSFYHFFPTKTALAAAALEEHWQDVQPKIAAILGAPTARAQLKALCAHIYEKQARSLRENGHVCGCPYATVSSELSGQDETLQQLGAELSKKFRGTMEQILRNAAREKLISSKGIAARAQEMHTYVIGAMMLARIQNSLDTVGKPLQNALLRISGLD